MDLDKLKKDIEEWFESDKGKASIEKEKEKNDLLLKRYLRFEEWLKHNDFDQLMYKLIHKHGEDYREKCYHNGFEPYPNNVLYFIINYIRENYDEIDVSQLNCEFPNYIWFFKGYYFQLICGQGCYYRIYNKEDMRMILQI